MNIKLLDQINTHIQREKQTELMILKNVYEKILGMKMTLDKTN